MYLSYATRNLHVLAVQGWYRNPSMPSVPQACSVFDSYVPNCVGLCLYIFFPSSQQDGCALPSLISGFPGGKHIYKEKSRRKGRHLYHKSQNVSRNPLQTSAYFLLVRTVPWLSRSFRESAKVRILIRHMFFPHM